MSCTDDDLGDRLEDFEENLNPQIGRNKLFVETEGCF